MEPTLPPPHDEVTLADYGAHPTQCRYCPALIGFILTTANTKPMPLDWKANPAGNMRVIARTPTGFPMAIAIDQEELFPPDVDTRWMPHFENCPGADEARRR